MASALANLGDGIFQFAIALLAVRLTRSPLLISGVVLAARLPWLILTLPAGAWADRWDRRRTMVRMNLIRTVLLAFLAAASAVDLASMALVYGVALALGCAEVLFDTSAQTLMPAVVESKDDLSKANGRLFAVEMILNQFVGPPLGGLIVAFSLAAAIGSSALLYGLAVIALAALPGTYRTERTGPPASLRADIGEGLRYLLGHRILRTFALLLGAQNLVFTAQMSVFVLFAVTHGESGLGLGEFGVGLLFTAGAVGGVAGSFVAAPLERAVGRTRVLALTLVVGGACLAAPGMFVNVPVAAASGVITGVTSVMWNVITVSLRQRIIPDQLLGRVNSGYRLLGWGTIPIGAALGGVVGEILGLRALFVITGGATMSLVIPLLMVVNDGSIADAERASVAT